MESLSYRSAGLLTTSLLLVGVGALSPASVHALGADSCSFGGNMEFPHCSSFTFDKQVDKTLKMVKSPTAGSGTVQFTQQSPGVWVVDVDFIQDLMAYAKGTFEYEIEIDPAPLNNFYFKEAGIAIIGPPVNNPTFSVTKTVPGMIPTALMADQIKDKQLGSFPNLLKKISVVDDYEVTNGSINSFQNSYTQIEDFGPPDEVPGPLPLLGAGAAFGFSRRLRTRVLAARRG
jgi:hypothetical protein